MSHILGLINARAGSKAVPGKNIRPLLGKPLIAYSIEVAKLSLLINRIVVSTDSPEIAKISRDYGAETPFLRPGGLATDNSLQIDSIIHAVDFLENEEGRSYDYVCLLQPTSPVRLSDDIDGVLNQLIASGADSVITVSPVNGFHPLTYYNMNDDGRLEPFMKTSSAGVIRQDFPDIFWRTGSVYAMRRKNLLSRTLYGTDIRGYVVPSERCANIDEPLDWEIAELLMKKHLGKY
jgi:CMP-N,N'-diacetyllegionaminic acid synthase